LVIDVLNGLTAKSIKEAADHLQLFLGLSSLLPSRGAPTLLILLSKIDSLPTASTITPIERAKAALGREMEKRRLMAGSMAAANQKLEGLESSSGFKGSLPSDENEIMQLDIFSGQSWDWDTLSTSVSWWAGSSLAESGLVGLQSWLEKHA
jgi:hypothetical protein